MNSDANDKENCRNTRRYLRKRLRQNFDGDLDLSTAAKWYELGRARPSRESTCFRAKILYPDGTDCTCNIRVGDGNTRQGSSDEKSGTNKAKDKPSERIHKIGPAISIRDSFNILRI